jgi:hypothetical protein
MTKTEIIEIQLRVGTQPDGIWGEKSAAACRKHLLSLMPIVSPWPKPDERNMTNFYGKSGDESNLVGLFVHGLGVKYDGSPVATIRCHRLVSDSLGRVIAEIAKTPAKWVLAQYAGCFNNRPMRGGSRPSKHSWGVAIDLAPGTNGLKQKWPAQSDMPLSVMEAFAREGWTSAGAFWGRDAMHFEATNPE